MPPPSSRMTKNQDRTHRYRPGKAIGETYDSDSDSDEDRAPPPPKPPVAKPQRKPAATTFPLHKKLPPAPIARKPEIDLDGFVTASESSSEEEEEASDESGEEESSDEGESESEEETKPKLIAPKFISKAQRAKLQDTPAKTEEQLVAEEHAKRQEQATALLQIQVDRDRLARAAGKKAWDDDDAVDDVDDTDGIDPEADHAAWKLRELKRVKRDRLALVEKEKEREEIERRKNLTADEREAEDREFMEQQKAYQEGRGKMAFMQKYFHKGAFFHGDDQDEEVKAALSRDLAGARFVDEYNKDTLPEYMRIRDMTQLGRKSRSKYKDMKAEDTGRWGDFTEKKTQYHGLDERFQADRGATQTGANSAPLGTRRPRDDDDNGRDDKRARLA